MRRDATWGLTSLSAIRKIGQEAIAAAIHRGTAPGCSAAKAGIGARSRFGLRMLEGRMGHRPLHLIQHIGGRLAAHQRRSQLSSTRPSVEPTLPSKSASSAARHGSRWLLATCSAARGVGHVVGGCILLAQLC